MLIIGAKGFAGELLEIVCQNNPDEQVAFYDDINADLPEAIFDKYEIIKNLKDAEKYLVSGDGKFALGTGNPLTRYKLAAKFRSIGGELISVISPFARIGRFANFVGTGSNILTGAIIESNNRIGSANLIHVNVLISHDVITGDFCEISPSVNLLGGVVVGNFCSIGTGATVLPKLKLGDNVIVGAGAVVTKNIPDNSMVCGVPAKVIKKLEPIDFQNE